MSGVPIPNTQALFYEQYQAARRDEVVGVLLALFLGTFGVHHFYLRRTGLGVLYCCFCWTSIPTFLGFIECFFMPGRVREFNAIQAAGIAAALGIGNPMWMPPPVNVTVNVPAANAAPGGVPASPQSAPMAGFIATQPVPAMGFVAAQPTMITCPRCQKTNPPMARFCGGCGNALQ